MTDKSTSSLSSNSQKDTAHTPGPWKYEQSATDPSDFIVTEPTGRTICEPNDPLYANDIEEFAPGLRFISVAEAQANARLIAAAPELLEALRRVIDSPWEPDKWRLEVNIAIAKAQGGTL